MKVKGKTMERATSNLMMTRAVDLSIEQVNAAVERAHRDEVEEQRGRLRKKIASLQAKLMVLEAELMNTDGSGYMGDDDEDDSPSIPEVGEVVAKKSQMLTALGALGLRQGESRYASYERYHDLESAASYTAKHRDSISRGVGVYVIDRVSLPNGAPLRMVIGDRLPGMVKLENGCAPRWARRDEYYRCEYELKQVINVLRRSQLKAKVEALFQGLSLSRRQGSRYEVTDPDSGETLGIAITRYLDEGDADMSRLSLYVLRPGKDDQYYYMDARELTDREYSGETIEFAESILARIEQLRK